MKSKQSPTSLPPERAGQRGPSPDPEGVVAILERMTRDSPCPEDTRNRANKYLREKELFLTPRGKKLSNKEKLRTEEARTLLLNALTLDEIFFGDTKLVVRILLKKVDAKELEARCRKSHQAIEQRAKIYTYWQQRLPEVELLLKGDFDLKTQRVDMASQQMGASSEPGISIPFALRAVRTLERIEQGRGNLGVTDKQLLQQADAYMALGDFDSAEERARQVVEGDPRNARAWFVRVIAALKQRNTALSEMRRHKVEATELADPMSAHERSAREAADEAGARAFEFQQRLDALVPEALANWPGSARGHYEHHDWRRTVVELMLAQAFRKVMLGGEFGESRRAFELNGFADEWRLKQDAPELPRRPSDPPPDPPLRQIERDVLMRLFGDRTRDGLIFFDWGCPDLLGRDFRLLHLRWLLRDEGYEQHWQMWMKDALSSRPMDFENQILGNTTLAPLWFAHCARHGGANVAHEAFSKWKSCSEQDLRKRTAVKFLELQVLAFHFLFARLDFLACVNVCDQAEELITRSEFDLPATRHPLESSVMVPSGRALYWQYLRALAAVHIRAKNGNLDSQFEALLLDADAWRLRFLDHERCFWLESEEYEDGGGEDYRTPPYDIDLCDLENWRNPVRNRDKPFENFTVHRLDMYNSEG